MKVVVLEDSEVDMLVIKQEINRCSYPFLVYDTESKDDYEKLVLDKKPDLIISDYVLPEYSGFNAFHFAKEHAPQAKFVFVTGALSFELAKETILGGASAFLLKESFQQLHNVINEVMQAKQNRKLSSNLNYVKSYLQTVNKEGEEVRKQCEAMMNQIRKNSNKRAGE